MRMLMTVLLLLASTTGVAAQEQTLFKGDIETGSFGGPVVKFTTLKDQLGVLVGGRGGWIINHRLVIGAGGYGVVNEIDAPEGALTNEGPLDLRFGYGGLEVEYLFRPNLLRHFGIRTLIGGGAANYVKDVGAVTRSNERAGETDVVLVLEPGLDAELNVTRWFRLNAGVSYRVVTGVDQAGLTNRDLRGMAATLNFKFGKF